MNRDWIAQARDELLALRGKSPGWGYRARSEAAVEPTALAALALRTCQAEGVSQVVGEAADWLASIQNKDGSVGISASVSSPGWPTAYALFVLGTQQRYQAQRQNAVNWLLRHQGHTRPAPAEIPIGHDSTIPGWSWIAETHSWLEPTALAVLALRGQGFEEHPRTALGVRLVCDRAVRSGGWNYGNVSVFGVELRPQPAPTGLALVSLARLEVPQTMVDRACEYLESELPKTRSAQSLGWGILGLDAWGRRPQAADQWLSDAYPRAARRPDSALQLAYVLLASCPTALDVFGI